MKKFICMLVITALLASGCAALAAPNYMVPDTFVSTYNSNVDYIANGYGSEAGYSSSDIREIIDMFQVNYTEQDSGILYYNNEDWSVECSCYYESGVVNSAYPADAVNLVLSGFAPEGAEIGAAALILAVCDLDGSLDAGDMLLWAQDALSGSSQPYVMGDYQMVLLRDDSSNHYQFAIFPVD